MVLCQIEWVNLTKNLITNIISKCDKEDKFSKETGFLMCMLKRVYGNTKSHKMLEEFVYSTEEKVKPKNKKKGKK